MRPQDLIGTRAPRSRCTRRTVLRGVAGPTGVVVLAAAGRSD